MTAAEMAPTIRFDRYLALLAVLLAIVLGLLVMSERQREPVDALRVEGPLPLTPDPRLATLASERAALRAEQQKLAATLAEHETALAASEAARRALENETGWLTEQTERLDRQLGEETARREALERRLAAVESERDRLAREVQAQTATRQRLEAKIAELTTAARPTSPAVGADEATAPRQPAASSTASSRPRRSPDLLIEDEQPAAAARGSRVAPGEGEPAAPPPATASATTEDDPRQPPQQRRLITFGGDGGTVGDGVAAYRNGDYAEAARIWGALAATDNARAQFHFGSLLFEGRLGEPDLVMAHVWLSRAIANGHLPAIEMRRRVRAAMSEADYETALAIEADS